MAVKPAKIALAYCAGIIDGEGCISISKSQRLKHNNLGNNQFDNGKIERKDTYYPDYSLHLIVVQKDNRICNWLYGNFGGTITTVKGGFSQQRYWRWVLSASQALELLKKMKPYLILKKAQALIAIEFGKSMKRNIHKPLTEEKTQIRENFYQQLKAIKRECAVVTTKPNPVYVERQNINRSDGLNCNDSKVAD